VKMEADYLLYRNAMCSQVYLCKQVYLLLTSSQLSQCKNGATSDMKSTSEFYYSVLPNFPYDLKGFLR
jgi:hypothetical protein